MSSRIVHDAMCFSKLANLAQLDEIGFAPILDDVVNCCNKLLGIVNLGS
jgi:hypothetical protein